MSTAQSTEQSIWHEDRLLIDGELVAAENGKTYETISPSTEEVLGTAADASIADTRRAIAAARRAFDTTDWSRDPAFRARCLHQLHQALLDNVENLRPILVHEVGAPVSSTSGPQLEMPIDIIGWYADLLDTYEFTEDLGNREAFGMVSHRWVEKEAAGVVAAIIAYNYPVQLALAKLGPALAAGCTVVLKGAPGHAVGLARARQADRREHRHPRRRRQRAHLVGQRGRRRVDDQP